MASCSIFKNAAYNNAAYNTAVEPLRLCPQLIQCPAHPERYAATSAAIMQALQDITPDIEVFSVDEAFLDVTHCQRLLGTPPAHGAARQAQSP